MTVRVERSFELPVDRERVWEFIADPGRRAGAISVVEDYAVHDDGSATWHIALPIPVVDRTVAVETEDEERREPEYVRFVGRSKVMKVVGEHELAETEGGTRVTNRFVVDGSLPGVERFFKRNLDDEMENLEAALAEDFGVEV
ncbi:CoxG family protein [Halosimplex halophilum]|uniref:CoxG family protein n=1 Tax=Halosimplex halophilum TaxID=2559572 RepID=UPI00107F395B|nr:SRPBCC family protein [Halosimplex halophilum]